MQDWSVTDEMCVDLILTWVSWFSTHFDFEGPKEDHYEIGLRGIYILPGFRRSPNGPELPNHRPKHR